MTRTHVVGGGLAGLAAALALVEAGRPVVLYESGPAAGGRCRSYFDRELGCRIDNGNHLLLTGNCAALSYLEALGTRGSLGGPAEPVFPFLDLPSGERWVLRPNLGRVPWWVLARGRSVPGASLREFLGLLRLRRAGAEATVAGVLAHGVLYRRLLEPLAVAALNTRPEVGSARLLDAVVRETLMRGGAACVPAFPREGLSESFVDPAVTWLRKRGAAVHLGRRVTGLEIADGRVAGLESTGGLEAVGVGDAVVLAVPPPVAAALLPGLVVPDAFEAILNVHYRVSADPGAAGFVGLIGGLAEWVFVKPGVVSVTVSAANHVIDQPAEALADRIWPEVCAALGLTGSMPPARVVKEKRATFAATPEQDGKRPGTRTALANLVLAGDWTATGLPATIEGAIRSGRAAARALIAG
ncbi:MAG TPA: hydroxysqualene dehydroxylase HpnE [Acetobacteraceae bacterium]|nr:hydroxysqualene dehydroxylase HpnE [Acetobacteraceae bacterium]